MSTSRPFAYNVGPPIDGTIQVGNLAVGTPTAGFTNNPQFWNGPDEDLGYVIAYPVSGGTHPTPIEGVFASVGFLGTKNMVSPFNESTFYELVNSSFNQSFTGGSEASEWLTNAGYWNSYSEITPTPTPTPTETPTPTSDVLINPLIVGDDEYLSVGDDEYLMFVNPSPSVTPSVTLTPTPTNV